MIKGFQHWAAWFRKSPQQQQPIAWESSPCLTADEKKAISRSVAMFEKGESSDGRQLLEKAMRATAFQPDQSYVEALRHFILEENRHSAYLGRFMEAEGIARMGNHWVDEVFRWLRQRGDLDWALRVLVTAEIIAVPYYTALRKATEATALKAICAQILRDEFMHLRFQGDALQELGKQQSKFANAVNRFSHRLLLEVTCGVVWLTHKRVFRRGGYRFFRFRNESVFLWFQLQEWMQGKGIHSAELLTSPALATAGVPFRSKGPVL